ncbi:hypothetical protein [Nocardia sp. NPDC056100]|uniref:hypothetical protein n=1 Tax=Nocardia sp. NPDC056100 TaxID=3345712 RepID=UPI0035DAC59D
MGEAKDGAGVAICFELVVNFGDNIDAARAAVLSCSRTSGRGPLGVGDHQIPLHAPLLRTDGPFIELSILPVAVGFGVALDGTVPRFALTAAELTALGNHLYELLAAFDGYVAATVGWDPEWMIDPAELKREWFDEPGEASPHGLVLSEATHAELGLGDGSIVFQPGYRWIPYRGESPSTLTAD